MSEDIPKPPRRRRWLMPLLVVSLALNLLIVGAIFGRALSPDRYDRDRVAGPVRSVIGEPFVRALSKDHRMALLADLKRDGPRIRETRNDLRTRFQALLVALRADPFDATEVQGLLKAQSQVAKGRQELGETLLLRRLEAMSADERTAYADRLERSLKRLRRR